MMAINLSRTPIQMEACFIRPLERDDVGQAASLEDKQLVNHHPKCCRIPETSPEVRFCLGRCSVNSKDQHFWQYHQETGNDHGFIHFGG